MWVALVPSGMDWLDTEIGGVPAAGVVAAVGAAGSGKTSLALGFAIAQLRRQNRVCYLTSETPEAVIETCRGMMELDLRPFVAQGQLTLLSFAPFFVNKVRSLNSNDPPLAELKELFDERRIQHVVFDTLDPMLSWIDGANAKVSVRNLLGQIQGWGRSVVCTMSGTTPAATELARTASGSIELGDGKLIVRHAGWCNVYDIEAPLQFVQGRGSVVRANAGRKPAGKSAMSDMSLIAASPLLPESERRPNLPPGADTHKPWMSLIGDANKILGPQAVIIASKDLFQQGERSQPPPPMSAAARSEPSPPTPRLPSAPQIINPPPPPQQQQQPQRYPSQPPPAAVQQQQQHGSQHPPPPPMQQHTQPQGSQHPMMPPPMQQAQPQQQQPYRAPYPSPAAPFTSPPHQQHYGTGPQPLHHQGAVSAMAANAMAAAAAMQQGGVPPHAGARPGLGPGAAAAAAGGIPAANQSFTGPQLPDSRELSMAATTAYQGQGRPPPPNNSKQEEEIAPISLIPNHAPMPAPRPDADMAATTAYNRPTGPPPHQAIDPDEARTLFRPADLNATAGPRPLEPPRIEVGKRQAGAGAVTGGLPPPSSSKTIVTPPLAVEDGNQARLSPSAIPRPQRK